MQTQKGSKDPLIELNALDAVRDIREQLIVLLESSDQNAKPVASIQRLLSVVEAELRHSDARPEMGPPINGGAYREIRNYLIEQRDGGEMLVEEWPGKGVDPFRCHSEVYDTIATVIAEYGDKGASFVQLMNAVKSRMGRSPVGHHVRMCLRFWIGRGILLRLRFRYHPKPKIDFVKIAEREWSSLAEISPQRGVDPSTGADRLPKNPVPVRKRLRASASK